MKKVLVTGSLGYIGSVLMPYLADNNYECTGYDTGFFRDCCLYPPKEEKTIFKDMRNFGGDDLKGVDAVVHLAAISNDPLESLPREKVYDPVRKYTIAIAKLCKSRGIRFVFASSCSVYGAGGQQVLTEQSPTNPQTGYSLNKLQIENDLAEMGDKDFSPVMLRFATAFGLSPRMRFDLVINMFAGMAVATKRIILNSDGKAWRPFVHIQDMCKAIRYGIDYDLEQDRPLVLNVGDAQANYQIIDLARMVKDAVPGSEITFLRNINDNSNGLDLVKDRKVQDGVDTRTYKVSFELIKKTFPGFRCDWSVKNGIREMTDCFKGLPLTEAHFNNVNFYRLQKMENLLKNGYLSEDLMWNRE
ncbi:MAG: SDR family oxidoreductase [Chloroflexi bacterium]|nr:SDR family oxidoreductase [Chloroflexota bacterium]